MCLSCICLLAMHTLIWVTFSLPPGVRGWLRLLLVALPGLFCLPFYSCDHIFGNKSTGTKKGRYSGGISIYYKNCFKDQIKIIEKKQCGIM